MTLISGLSKLSNLVELQLAENQLTEIKGLENLVIKMKYHLNSQVNLEVLELSYNKITSLKGIENLTKLKELWVILHFFGKN